VAGQPPRAGGDRNQDGALCAFIPSFVERLVGTLRRECLDRTLFWTTTDLEAKLLAFQHYLMSIERTPDAKGPAGNGRQRRSFTRKSQLLSMEEALSRLIPDADGRLILVIRHRHVNSGDLEVKAV
jgi:hypothetical protein